MCLRLLLEKWDVGWCLVGLESSSTAVFRYAGSFLVFIL